MYCNTKLGNFTISWDSCYVNSIGNRFFTIAMVSVVFKRRDFHFQLLGLGPKRKLNGNRMCFCNPCISTKSVYFDNILITFCQSHTKLVPVQTENKCYHILNFFLQPSIYGWTIVLQW